MPDYELVRMAPELVARLEAGEVSPVVLVTVHRHDDGTLDLVVNDASDKLAQERHRTEAVEIDLQNSEVVVRTLRRKITQLENDREREMEAKRDGSQIERIAQAWRDKCGHPRAKVSVGSKRADAVWARLTSRPVSFSEEELMRAVHGASLYPFVGQGGRVQHGTPKQRFDDLELIMRDEKMVEQFIRLADMHDAENAAKAEEVAPDDADVSQMW